MKAQRFPVGIETFSDIIEGGYVYIDKTRFIHEMISGSKYYFLSRPRRFGKSLMISTLQAFFEGRHDLFNGLDISRHDYDWEPHPVFRLNLVNASTSSTDRLKSILESHLSEWEEEYEITHNAFDYPQRFYRCIQKSVQKTGRKAVVLVDEYDKPIVSSLHNDSLNKQLRDILKPLYGTLKAADEYIQFAFLTGVSRFSRLSIFSDLNNLTDISLSEKYASICGITEEEMLLHCQGGINSIVESKGIKFEEVVALLKKQYDGYHFTPSCPDIYNPYSLFSAFELKEINSFWFATGTPTFLIKALRNGDFFLPDLNNEKTSAIDMAASESYMANPIPMLFQTGYLTISDYNPRRRTYTLRIPNLEVEEGLFQHLLPVYMNRQGTSETKTIDKLLDEIEDGKPEEFLSRLKAFLSDIPYELSRCKPEIYFENNLYIIFKLLGFAVDAEYRTASGRIDLLLRTDRFIYLMELKLNGTPEEALSQIDSKDYLIPFTCDDHRLFKIGISFSSATRNIDRWLIEHK